MKKIVLYAGNTQYLILLDEVKMYQWSQSAGKILLTQEILNDYTHNPKEGEDIV